MLSLGGRIEEVRNPLLGRDVRVAPAGRVYLLGEGGYSSLPEIARQLYLDEAGGGTPPATLAQPVTVSLGADAASLDLGMLVHAGTPTTAFDDGTYGPWEPYQAYNPPPLSVTERLGSEGFGCTFTSVNHVLSRSLTATKAAVSFYVKRTGALTDDGALLKWNNSVLLHTAYDGEQFAVYTPAVASTPFEADTWHLVTVHIDSVTDRHRVWIDGTLLTDVTGYWDLGANPTLTLCHTTYPLAIDDVRVEANVDEPSFWRPEPTSANRLTVTGRTAATEVAEIALGGLDYVTFDGLDFTGAVAFEGVAGLAVVNSVLRDSVTLTDCANPLVAHCVLRYGTSGNLLFDNCTGSVQRNNLYLNRANAVGWSAVDCTLDSDYNAYYPTAPDPAETNSLTLASAPELAANGWRLTDAESELIGAGDPNVGGPGPGATVVADIRHVLRPSAPAIGAVELLVEVATYDIAGRLATRTLAGRVFSYTYDGEGRLTGFTDSADSANNATYTYDVFGRRIRMQVGACVTRMVYDGDDVVADLIDEDNDGEIDRTRIYWLTGQIDQRIGFVDLAASGNVQGAYYYLCDQVGSVLQVIDANGTVVNQYDYDAYGNLRPETSYETVENRYRFQGREWDAHAGHYYYRYRTYLPEWGMFTGPDPNIRLEPEGPGNYVFCLNDPIGKIDPFGLESGFEAWLANRWQDAKEIGQGLVIDPSGRLTGISLGEVTIGGWETGGKTATNAAAGAVVATFTFGQVNDYRVYDLTE